MYIHTHARTHLHIICAKTYVYVHADPSFCRPSLFLSGETEREASLSAMAPGHRLCQSTRDPSCIIWRRAKCLHACLSKCKINICVFLSTNVHTDVQACLHACIHTVTWACTYICTKKSIHTCIVWGTYLGARPCTSKGQTLHALKEAMVRESAQMRCCARKLSATQAPKTLRTQRSTSLPNLHGTQQRTHA